MTTFTRGNAIIVSGTFKPKAGQAGTATSAAVRFVYTNVSGATATDNLSMTLGADGVTWSVSWDSTLCKSGLVQWWARSAGTLIAAAQGDFTIEANAANT